MTIEEAKRRMEICRDFLANNYSDMGEPNFTAFNMAIEALEQQPCEDCISRKEALRHRHIIYDDDGVGYSVVRVDEIEQLPSVTPQQPCEEKNPNCTECRYYDHENHHCPRFCQVIENTMAEITSEQPRWIPVSERLPEDLKPVNITWVNHEPEPYYHDIKDKNFVATGIHYRGRWYWYSTTCADYLGEYGSNDIDKVDDAVEIVAWMPLPEGYKEEDE